MEDPFINHVADVADVAHPQEETAPQLLGEALNAAVEMLNRFVVWPHEHATTVVALWAAHTYVVKDANASPRLLINSALPGSGKSVALRLVTGTSKKGRMVSGTTPSALFRSLDREADDPVMLGIDEVDNLFKGETHSLNSLINSGWQSDGTIQKSAKGSGDGDWDAKEFRVFAPLALCGIDNGSIAGPVMSRSIVITMMPASPEDADRISAFRHRRDQKSLTSVADKFVAWRIAMDEDLKNGHRKRLLNLIDREAKELDLPGGHHGRSVERWEILIALADYVGGLWPAKVRAAYEHVTAIEREFAVEEASLELLKGMFYVFDYFERDRVTTAEAVRAFTSFETEEHPGLDTNPWRSWGLDARKLSRKLKPYGIGPKDLRVPWSGQSKVLKGYERADFLPVWARFAPEVLTSESATSATSATAGIWN